MADQEYLYVTGRFVQGDMFTPNTKNMQGGPLKNLKGEDKVEYFIAVASPKTDPGTMATWAKLQAIAKAGFPGGQSAHTTFAWKVADGDAPQNTGKEGFAGCLVFKLKSGYPIPLYQRSGQEFGRITEANRIKRGDYVRAAFTAVPNGNVTKPGLYLNPTAIEIVGYGDEIISGPDAATVLGAAGPVTLPPGASPTPVASGPMPGVTPPAGPATAPPPVPAAAPPPPAHDFLKPPVMTAKAAGMSYQQFKDTGWTDELLIQHGYMEPR